jgi:hypothetical protein
VKSCSADEAGAASLVGIDRASADVAESTAAKVEVSFILEESSRGSFEKCFEFSDRSVVMVWVPLVNHGNTLDTQQPPLMSSYAEVDTLLSS